ncbi:nuclear transport factor 2 family protein [Paenibacillus psychroresistens]|uniref:Nuclear transport factor 2 family protein n=1 Tax=Paenibacillus psychroresistens TaxID=1778678 RepID=A0A6B8RHR0_9BACL|nr:nuclear transport factor 2 family protein [Paenibacillus psychroresistens]QGQ95092.1 nuclear transport factor 2 family protein [Paenibacillus psychroresistens]
MSGQTLEQRIQKLEDIEAIQKLQYTYGHYVDKGWNGKEVFFDKLPSLFTADATWTSAAMGVDVKGALEIVEMLKVQTAGGELGMHSFTNDIVDVDRDTATGKYLLWVGIKGSGQANLVYQSEDVRYVREADGWKIQSIVLDFASMLNS